MWAFLSLRLRIFLFFALLVMGATGIAAGALAFGWWRAAPPVEATAFVTSFLIFAFLNAGLAVAVWLLFDENVAKPVQKLAADLRLRAHSGVIDELDASAARYLGDLAPAAAALSREAHSVLEQASAQTSRDGQKLSADLNRLCDLLSQIPIATVVLNSSLEIILYDAQAADLLGTVAPIRLRAPLADYIEPECLTSACDAARRVGDFHAFALICPGWPEATNARIKARDEGGFTLFIDLPTVQLEPPVAARPLVFDFATPLAANSEWKQTGLGDLCFVVLDTETTGLSVSEDDIIQIGALRVLNRQIVPGEVFDTYVNPGRAIPAASSRIHRITDADIANAPDSARAAKQLHHFAQDAVLVAHNAPFDIGMLKRLEAEIDGRWDHPVLDTVLMSAVVFGTHEDHSLDALCERLGIDIPSADRHTALGDAKVTADAFLRLLAVLEGRGLYTLGELLAATDREAKRLYQKVY